MDSQAFNFIQRDRQGRDAMKTTNLPDSAPRTAGIFSGQACLGGVLLVDDEPDIRKIVRMTLEKMGYYVIEAEDGQQAITLLNEGEHPMVIDVIITDIRMSHINGVEAMDYFQREYPSIPIIFLTGFPDLDLAISLIKRGATDYLVKPVDREKLISAVDHAMNRRHVNWFS